MRPGSTESPHRLDPTKRPTLLPFLPNPICDKVIGAELTGSLCAPVQFLRVKRISPSGSNPLPRVIFMKISIWFRNRVIGTSCTGIMAVARTKSGQNFAIGQVRLFFPLLTDHGLSVFCPTTRSGFERGLSPIIKPIYWPDCCRLSHMYKHV